MKILEFCGENRLEFVEKRKTIKIWGMISIEQVKVSNRPAKHCVFGLKEKKILKNFKKILRFSDQNHYGNWLFSHFLLNISWISDLSPKVYTSGRSHQISTTIFPISGGTFQMFLHTVDADALDMSSAIYSTYIGSDKRQRLPHLEKLRNMWRKYVIHLKYI